MFYARLINFSVLVFEGKKNSYLNLKSIVFVGKSTIDYNINIDLM